MTNTETNTKTETTISSRQTPSRKNRSRKKALSRYQQFNCTDAGNAELFARMFKDDIRFDHKRKRWLYWDQHRWREDKEDKVFQKAKCLARWRAQAASLVEDPDKRKSVLKWAYTSESRSKIEAMLRLAQSEQPVAENGENWDHDPLLLGVQNGVVNLKNGRLRAGQRTDRITLCTNITYDPTARCPRFLQFVDEIFGGDAQMIQYVHRALGYSITGLTSEQVLFQGYGSGANGKSTLLNVIRHVLGDYADDMPFSAFELNARSNIPNDIACMVGRRFITAAETNESVQLNEARIKSLTGGDPQKARNLYKEFFSFQPVSKIWLSFNHRPYVRDDSEGYWRRIRLIPFEQHFSEDKRDKDLESALRLEAPGILNWLVRGCRDWQAFGLGEALRVQQATQEYRQDSDPVQVFLEERCVLSPNARVSASDLRQAYSEWSETNKERMLDWTSFSQRLKSRGLESRAAGHHKVRTWFGIGLKETPTEGPSELVPVRADAGTQVHSLVN